MYGKVKQPWWDDRPVAVVAGGPSLIDFDFEKLRGAHVLAVKSRIFDIPWADAGFGFDGQRFIEWRDRLANVQARIYWAVRADEDMIPQPKNTTLLKHLYGRAVSPDPSEIYGDTAGFGAMQICIHKRAKQIVLFGFDFDKEPNWHLWAEHFAVLSPYLTEHGISVMNACPSSTIRCFQKVALQDAVSMIQSKVAA